MNTYALVAFIMVFNIAMGALIGFQESNSQGYYILTAKQMEANSQTQIVQKQAFTDTHASSNEQNSDKRTGNENTITLWLTNIIGGIGDLYGLTGNTQIEWIIVSIIKVFYTFVNIVCGLVLFDKWKNKKVD